MKSIYKDQNGTIKSWNFGWIYIQQYIRPKPNERWFFAVGCCWKQLWFESKGGNWRVIF